MIQINENTQCCGCNACGDICTHNAISYETDQEGFWYPKVDIGLCTNCGLCEQVCPMRKDNWVPKEQFETPVCYGAYNKDPVIRFNSTSGGVFSALASTIFKHGGYVSGAVYTDNFHVNNIISDSPDDMERLRSSKYIQSSAKALYLTIKKLLKKGERVLACGTPCQMAALRSFIGDIPNTLLIVDILCKSCNSPKVFQKYLLFLEKRYNSRVVAIKERDKKYGWNSLTRRVSFINGQDFFGKGYSDHFQRGFQYNIYARPSCYDCLFKGIPRIGDITIGDFWGIEKIDDSLSDDKGTSMVFLNNKKGQSFFEQAKEELIWKKVKLSDILEGNRTAIMKNRLPYPNDVDREAFFRDLDVMPFDKVAKKHFSLPRRTIISILRQKTKGVLSSIKKHL